MLTYRSTTILFFVTTLICCFLHYYLHTTTLFFLIPFGFYLGMIVYGSARIQSGFYEKAFCNGETNEKIIAITFDDGPNTNHTPEILKTLKEYNVSATFFLIGKNIEGNEQIVKQIDSSGHTIGNHSFSHSFFIDFKTKPGFIFELNQTSDLIFKTIGKRTTLFRPPYGVTTPNLVSASNALNYKIIGWDVRSLDTTKDSIETIANRVKKHTKMGSIILFHDTSSKTAKVLKQTLIFAKDNGFKVVGLEELLNLKAYA